MFPQQQGGKTAQVALSSSASDDLQIANTLFYSSIICNTKTSQENTL
jgi:hypothetical protein